MVILLTRVKLSEWVRLQLPLVSSRTELSVQLHLNEDIYFNFTIDSCGVQINHKELADITGNASKSIVFTNTTNVVLQGLVVANSNGYGLMISDCFGSVLLNNSSLRTTK